MAFAIWDWNKEPVLEGKLTAKLNNIPPYGKKLYGIETDDGHIWYTWGYYTIVGHLAPLNFMTKLRLRYIGMGFEKEDDPHKKKLFELTILELPKEKKKKVARNNIKK